MDQEQEEEFARRLQEAARQAFQALGDDVEVHVVKGDGQTVDGVELPEEVAENIKHRDFKKQLAKRHAKDIDFVGRMVQTTMVNWMVWANAESSEGSVKEWLRQFVADGMLIATAPDFEEHKDEREAQMVLIANEYAAAMAVFMEAIGDAADKYPLIGRGGCL